MERCAYLYVDHKWVQYNNPTISDLRKLRQMGAVVMHKVTKRIGNMLHTSWVTDKGVPVTERTDFNG